MSGRARRVALAAALLLAAPACGDGSGSGGSGSASGSGAASGVEVERVELATPVVRELVAAGDALVAGVVGEEGAGAVTGVQVSDDGGRDWQRVELPGAPDALALDLDRPSRVGGVVVVTGRAVVERRGNEVPGGGAYVWTSADGRRWHGAELAESGPPFGAVGVAGADGVLVAGFTTGRSGFLSAGRLGLWRSTDAGATWQRAEVPDLGLTPGETARVEDAWTLPDGRLAVGVTTSGGTSSSVELAPSGSAAPPDAGRAPAPGGPSGSGHGSAGSSGSPSAGTGGSSGSGEGSAGSSGSSPAELGGSSASGEGSASAGASSGVARGGGGTTTTVPAGGPGQAPPAGGSADGATMLVSGDGGATWARAPCPARDTDGRLCAPPEAAGDLLYRGGEVSVDGGRTWRATEITPPAEPDFEPPRIDGVVEDGSGGWLAAASLDVPSDQSHGFLLGSEDGRRWRQLRHPDPCWDQDVGRPNSSYSVPVRLGGRWLVAYSCLGLSTPVTAELLAVVGASDAEATAVPDSQRDDVSYGDPVALGDTVVLPELAEGRSHIVALTVVTP